MLDSVYCLGGPDAVSIVGIEEIEIALQVGQEKHPLVPPPSTHRTVLCASLSYVLFLSYLI